MSLQVEKFGLDAVPATLRTSRWYDYLVLQFAFSFNAGNFLLPALAVSQGHLSFFWAVASIVLGSFIAYVLVSVFSIPGVDYGIPGQYAMRLTLGVKGSRFFSSPLRAVISVYWFAVQSLGAAVVVQSYLERYAIISIGVIPIAIVLAVMMTIIAVVGYGAVTAVIRLMFPLMIMIMALIWILFLNADAPSFQWSHVAALQGENNWLVFFIYSGLAFAQYVAAISGSADICRYAKSRKDAVVGLMTGNFLGMLITAILAAYAMIAAGQWNPYVAAAGVTNSYWIQWIILMGVVISLFAINLNNAYTGGFSLLNTFPRLKRSYATACIGLLAAILCFLPSVIDDANIFISLLGSLAVPLAGVIMADYLFIKKMKIDVLALHKGEGIYQYSHGFNISALAAIGIGAVYYYIAPDVLLPSLTSCLLAGALYCLILYVQSAHQRRSARKIPHVEMVNTDTV
jgi:NCS1 nucleoside transporter family